MDSYRVVFNGEILEGFEQDQVAASLGQTFHINDQAKLNRLFSGKTAILRKGVDRHTAQSFSDRLEAIGARCRIEKIEADSSAWLSLDGDSAAANAGAANDSEPAQQTESAGAQPAQGSAIAATSDAPGRSAALEGLSLVPIEEEASEEPAPDEASPQRGAGTAQFGARELPARHEATVQRSGSEAAPKPTLAMKAGANAAASLVMNANTSGEGSAAQVPADAGGLCWGGFFLGWIWAAFNGVWIGLLGLVPILSLPIAILLLIKGREWAWQKKRWRDSDHFNAVQRKWSIAGLVLVLSMGFLWVQFVRDVSEFTPEESAAMEEQRNELRQRLEKTKDPNKRAQLEALIQFQESLQKQLEESQSKR